MNHSATASLFQSPTFWYSTIEVAPGVFTPGLDIPTVSFPRQILPRIPVKELDCLDVGCVEGVMAVLMCRQGAKHVVAYDRVDWTEKISAVRSIYAAEFEYVTGCNYFSLLDRLKSHSCYPFDFVNFSGVLYHMFDPVMGIMRTRSLVRDGGLVLIETSAMMRDEVSAYFNDDGRLLGPPNYTLPTVPWLDYIMRLARFEPLDVLCSHRGTPGTNPDHVRIAIVGRAVPQPLVFLDRRWDDHLVSDYRDYLDWSLLRLDKPPVEYNPVAKPITRTDGTIDLLATVRANGPSEYDLSHTALRLADVR